MSDDFSLMTQKEMMRQVYSLQKERVENDTRLQVQMNEVIKRLDHREKTFEKINEEFGKISGEFGKISGELAGQKKVFLELDGVNKKLSGLDEKLEGLIEWKNEQEKTHALENKDGEILGSKITGLIEWQGVANKRLEILENKTAKTVFTVVKKIGGIVLTMIVTAVTAYLIGKFKG